jgi:O-antigen ligase
VSVESAAARADDPPSFSRDPVTLAVGLGAIGILAAVLGRTGLPLHPAEAVMAVGLITFFVISVLLSPANGLVLLYLVPPLFNGEDGRPYFWLLEVLVYLTVVVGLVTRLRRRQRLVVPHGILLALFFASTLVSLPLNLREVWLQLQVSPWSEVLQGIRRADLWDNLFYVRTVLNVASGIGLFVLVVNEPWPRERIARLAASIGLVYVVMTALGLWCHWRPAPPPGTFLTLWLGGPLLEGFQSLGFNMSYFAQYALAYLPLMALPLALTDAAPRWAAAIALLSLIVSGYTILAAHQRTAYLLFLMEVLLLVAAAVSWRRTRRGPAVLVLGMGGLVATAVGLVVFSPLGHDMVVHVKQLWSTGDPYRVKALSVTWRMFRDEPLLGIGSGRFAGVFFQYDPEPRMQWGSLSAHNIYAQFLAEQGGLGLASFLLLVGAVVIPAVRSVRRGGQGQTPLVLVLISMACWLTYGCLQYTFLMRSMQGYFWITLGLLLVLSERGFGRPMSKRWLVAIVAAVLVLGSLRVEAGLRRPVPVGYAWGLYPGEPDQIRWTRGGAVFNFPANGTGLTLAFAFPIPQVIHRPQHVTVIVDGKPFRQIVFDSPWTWEVVDIPVDKPRGTPVLVQVGVSRTVVPAALRINSDTRTLGVLMKPPVWR